MNKTKAYFVLNVLFFIYSAEAIACKVAISSPMFSCRFFTMVACAFVLLGIYAVGWQQIIKIIPLSTAYSNKAITIAWGTLWGVLLYGERVGTMKIAGELLVILGIIIYAFADGENE